MNGSSQYHFSHGSVTITNTDPDGYAPNDADLQKVYTAMAQMATSQQPAHLTFNVDNLHVEVEVSEQNILAEALKPLRAKQAPDHTPDTTRSNLLGSAGDVYEFVEGQVGLFWHGYWVKKNGEALNVSISHEGLANQWVVAHWDSFIVSLPKAYCDTVEQAEQFIRENY